MCAYGMGRNVVRVALDLLRSDGYVTRLQGRGTLVVSRRAVHDLASSKGIGVTYRGGGQRVITRFRSVSTEPAPPTVAVKLGLEHGAPCFVADYETLIDRDPYAVATSYLAGDAVADVFSGDLDGDWYGDWFDVLAALGVSTGRLDVQVEATAELLSVPVATPLLRFERLLHDDVGDPIDFGFSRCRSDRIVLRAGRPDAEVGMIPEA